MIDGVNSLNEALLAIIGLGGSTGLIYRFLWRGKGDHQPGLVKSLIRKSNLAYDTLVGSEPIMDPETGRELRPALPGIGTRMAKTEETLVTLTEAVAKIADSHVRINDIETRLSYVERTIGIERTASRIESIQLLSTMEAAIRAEPSSLDEIEEPEQ